MPNAHQSSAPASSTARVTANGQTWWQRYGGLSIAGIVASLLAGYAWYFFQTYERVDAPPSYTLSPKATTNRFYAAERLLELQHKNVSVHKGDTAANALNQVWQQPSTLAKHSAVIVYSVSKSQAASIPQMLKWVQNGGHLITFSQRALPNRGSDDQQHRNHTKSRAEIETDDLRQYQLNENTILQYLGIINRDNSEMANGKNLQSLDEIIKGLGQDPENIGKTNTPINEATPTSSPAATPNPTNCPNTCAARKFNFNNKVVMRLPLLPLLATNHYGQKFANSPLETTQTNKQLEAVIATTTHSHLDSQAFWQKYPNSQKVSGYNWMTKNGTLLDPNQTQLNSNEQQRLALFFSQQASQQQKASQIIALADDTMLDVRLGEGRLTVINDKNVFSNPNPSGLVSLKPNSSEKPSADISPLGQLLQQQSSYPNNIAQFDNGTLLQYLVADQQQIWLVPNIDVPSLPTMLWRNAKWACVAFLLLLLAALLAMPKRFGRLRPYQNDSERNIFGYFDHIGQYLWHTDMARALVAQNRTRLIEQIIAHHPALVRPNSDSAANMNVMDKSDQICQTVSEALNIGKSAVQQALYNDWHNAEQFLQCSRQFALLNNFYR